MAGNRKKTFIFRVIGLTMLAGAISFLWWQFGPFSDRNNSNRKILATGTIEATEVDVSAEIGGKIEKLLVDEGYRVERGQLIAKLESSQPAAEVLRAEAALASARSTLADLEAGARSEELQRARAQVELARAKLELDEAEWRRASDLYKAGVVSEDRMDAARASRDVSKSQYDVAVEELKLLEAGSRPDQIKAARGQVKQAEAALQLARIRLEKSEIPSPVTGTVLVKDSEEGEVVSPGVPIVTVADLGDMWVKIYIDETEIGNVKIGQPAKVRVDSFPGREFPGSVTYISDEAEFTPKNIQTREDRVKLVFAVKVGIDDEGGLLKPGMYADIELEALSPEPKEHGAGSGEGGG